MKALLRPLIPSLCALLAVTGCDDSEDNSNVDADQSTAAFSNMMIFGDSQSDIGNQPESIYYSHDPESDSHNGIPSNLFVPVSNPLTESLFDPLFPRTVEFTHNTEFYRYIAPAVKADAVCTGEFSETAVCNEREGRSVGWVEYVGFNGSRPEGEGLFDQVTLASWAARGQTTTEGLSKVSVGYAWYGAVSDLTGCWGPAQNQMLGVTCGRSDIEERQNAYRNSQQLTDGKPNASAEASYNLEYEAPVPTLKQQVDELFLVDLDDDPNMVDEDTLYIVYNGANDLSVAFFDWLGGDISYQTFCTDITQTIPQEIIGADDAAVEAMLDGLIERDVKSGTVLVMPQYNLGMTPKISYTANITDPAISKILAVFLGELVRAFNSSLQYYVKQTATKSKYSDFDFIYLDHLYLNMSEYAFTEFSSTFGQACQDDTTLVADKTVQDGEATACLNDEQAPYLFWNTTHLASPGQQIIAKTVLKALSDGDTVTEDTPVRLPGCSDYTAIVDAITQIREENNINF